MQSAVTAETSGGLATTVQDRPLRPALRATLERARARLDRYRGAGAARRGGRLRFLLAAGPPPLPLPPRPSAGRLGRLVAPGRPRRDHAENGDRTPRSLLQLPQPRPHR